MISSSKLLNNLLAVIILLQACSGSGDSAVLTKGQPTPDFKATTLDGADFQLEELKGHYILLDFWGSWCAPCRKEHPELVELYEDFSEKKFKAAKGFEVVSVAIERDSSAWVNAVNKDGLPWPYQIMEQTDDLQKAKTPIAGIFQIEQVPFRYLLDENGKIAGINPSLTAVRTYLNTK